MINRFKPAKDHDSVSYTLAFDLHGPGWGVAFDCDEHGNVAPGYISANPDRERNYQAALTSGVKPYVQRYEHHYRAPASGVCCGLGLYLDLYTNTCPACGTDYDSAGHELAPREQWGEETGESVADILAADRGDDF
jgi:hypothetical protein